MSEERGSEWLYRCQAIGCILKPSVMRDGQQLCTFHHGKDPGEGMRSWSAISEAIKTNEHLIKKTFGLMLKGTEFWADPKFYNSVMGWGFCPMKADEVPMTYTARLLNKVQQAIYEEAEQNIIRGKV